MQEATAFAAKFDTAWDRFLGCVHLEGIEMSRIPSTVKHVSNRRRITTHLSTSTLRRRLHASAVIPALIFTLIIGACFSPTIVDDPSESSSTHDVLSGDLATEGTSTDPSTTVVTSSVDGGTTDTSPMEPPECVLAAFNQTEFDNSCFQ